MDLSHSIPSVVKSISFSFISAEDVRKISVKQIVNPVLFDPLNRPNTGGLYDSALGPTEKQDICATCRLNYFNCPGHFGHIELPIPVFHPLFMMNTYNLLRAVCLYCHHFKCSRPLLMKCFAKLQLLEHGLLREAGIIDDFNYRPPRPSDEDIEGDVDGIDDESLRIYQEKLNLFITHTIKKLGSTRDHYKDGLVFQARKDVIIEFLKGAMLKKCQNTACGAYAHSFRKEGHTKIVEYGLSPKQKLHHQTLGLRRLDVLAITPVVNGKVVDAMEADDSDSEPEPPGESLSSDDEHAAGDDVEAELPKAITGKVKTKRGLSERIVPPQEVREHLRKLFANEAGMCVMLFGRHGKLTSGANGNKFTPTADMFFLEAISVPPTRFRPPAKMGETIFEHPANELLTKLLNTSFRLRDINEDLRKPVVVPTLEGDKPTEPINRPRLQAKFLDELIQLQVDVNSFIDSSKNPTRMRQGKLPPAGIKQGLEKKEGLFRKNMMGKRVNYAARSVISPDVNIEPSEIGVPPVFARKLTFPEPVTPYNVHHLSRLVQNGTATYPGASMVEYEDGTQQTLDKLDEAQRAAIVNQLLTPQEGVKGSTVSHGLRPSVSGVGKKVYRHLVDGDILILNRQPTLHKPSMMAHRAKVLKGEKTIRMHYANCNSYNADFDGDEMNIHFPQNQIARAEAEVIANTDNQYLVPTSGKPLRGLIQDHVVAGVWMTNKATFFTREEYHQLIYGALRPDDELVDGLSIKVKQLEPAICKPALLWTGKQVISTILLNIKPNNAEGLHLLSKSKIPNKLWGPHSTEETVIFFDGLLLSGVLDKSQFGASEFGLVHAVYDLYGAKAAGRLLGILSRLFTNYLQHRAFTCRIDDLALTPDGDAARREIMESASSLGTQAATQNFSALDSTREEDRPAVLKSLLREILFDSNRMGALDAVVQSEMRKLHKSIADAVMPSGLIRKFPDNHMQAMTISGAKGSAVNVLQISCGLGQQALEGRRVPVMVSGKTLPSFQPFESDAIAGGYIGSRFLTGIRPQEFFFHCMAGREGLIDTAVKTSRSGYLQRCLIKHLEGLQVHYDNTVRGSDSSIYQFIYGGDGLDVTKQKHLYQFEFSTRNWQSLLNRYQPRHVADKVDDSTAFEHMKKVLKAITKKKPIIPGPALSIFNPVRYLGSTSETYAAAVEKYLREDPQKLIKNKKHEEKKTNSKIEPIGAMLYRNLTSVRYMRSLVEPGEAVGLLASQGVGEPSTQMTLNTFHFAGHGAANVTLGIPRLREIIMSASTKPKTPTMTIKSSSRRDKAELDAFCKKASRLTLSQLVESVEVEESIAPPIKAMEGSRRKRYKVQISFYPPEEYSNEYHIRTKQVHMVIGTRFGHVLKKELAAELKRLDADLKSQKSGIGKGQVPKNQADDNGGEGEDEDEGEDQPPVRDDNVSEIGDGDAEDAKRARQTHEQASYSDDESSTDEAEELAEPDADSDAEGSDALEEAEKTKTPEDLFMHALPYATNFSFKASHCKFALEFGLDFPKILLVGVLERSCIKTVIREIPGISDCFLLKEQPKPRSHEVASEHYTLMTNGANIPGFWSHISQDEQILRNEIYTNDIYAMLVHYGVEAARATLINEISSVFGAYNIDVNFRHLELIADYMTFDGGYKPFNRKGISTNSSPLLKASYETTASFICDAALFGDFDDLTSPSGNIVLGRPTKSGTGCFDVVLPLTA